LPLLLPLLLTVHLTAHSFLPFLGAYGH